MKTIFTSIVLTIFSLPLLLAQNNIEVSATDNWIGFMNVFNLDGTYNFGSGWEVSALKTTFDTDANTVILQPNFNTYAENQTDEFWVNQTTGEGNKNMEALTFVEPGATFNGVDLTFSGTVESYTLDAAYNVQYFIKALDPANGFADALGGASVFDLPTSGTFSVSVPGAQLTAGLVIQYGFSVTGRNANPDNEAALGNVTIGPGSVSVDNVLVDHGFFRLQPNVTAQATNLYFANPLSETAQVSLYDLNGRNLRQFALQAGTREHQLDVQNLPEGVYMLSIRSGKILGTQRLMVKK